MSTAVLYGTVTCPRCRTRTEDAMPTDACAYFWDCPACGTTLKPKAGDCCIFCSYGDVPCPPVQLESEGGGCRC